MIKPIKKFFSIIAYFFKSTFSFLKEVRARKSRFDLLLKNVSGEEKRIEIYSEINHNSKLVSQQNISGTLKNFDFYCFQILIDLIGLTGIPYEKRIIAIKLPFFLWCRIMWNIDNEEHKDIYKAYFALSNRNFVLLPRLWFY